MRILFTFENPLPNSAADAEVFVHTAAALARRGHPSTLIVPALRGESTGEMSERVREHFDVRGPLEIRPLPVATRSPTLAHIAHATRLLTLRTRADLVYTRNLYAARMSLMSGQRVFFEHYRPWGDQVPPFQPWIRGVMGHPGFIGMVAHSEVARRAYMRLGAPPDAIEVVHNGYDPARMEPRLTRAEARASTGYGMDERVVVYTGRVNNKKGLGTVLQMARALPEARFVLVGSEKKGPIERKAATLSNVDIVPWQNADGLARYLYAADVLIVPPTNEPLQHHGSTVLPLKLFLYLAAGRVIFAADTPDVRELLHDDQNAVLVAPDDVEASVRQLRALFEDETRMQRIAANAWQDSKRLTWDARAEHIERVLVRRMAGPRVHLEPNWNASQWMRECASWLRTGMKSGHWIAASP